MNAIADPQRFDGQTVLVAGAHPDDKTYLSAGPIARTINTGGDIACVHATFDALAAHASQTNGLAHAMGTHVHRRSYDIESFGSPTASEIDSATSMAGVA